MKGILIFSSFVGCALLTSCGVNGDKIFGSHAHMDYIQSAQTTAEPTVIDVLANDGGSGRIIEDVTQGYHGTVTIGTGGFDVNYEPNSVSDDTYYADWFEYRIRSNNFSESVARVAVRFPEMPTDRYEPDDFQEFARPLNLQLGFPKVEDHTTDIRNPIPSSTDLFLGLGNTTIGGDEDWFVLDVPTVSAGLGSWLKIETILPNVSDMNEHTALIITVMDQWGFVARDTLGRNAVDIAGSGPSSNDATGSNHATTLDREMSPGRYLIRISPHLGHAGPYKVRFLVYEAAPAVVAPMAISLLRKHKY